MTVPSHYGVLASGTGGGGVGAAFVTEHHYTASGTSQVVSFSGASEGHLAIIITALRAAATTPAGWTLLADTNWGLPFNRTFWKILDAADILAGSVTITCTQTNSLVSALFYSGVTAASLAASGTGSGTGITIPGFTKSGGCKAIVVYASWATAADAPAAPGTTTNRIARYTSAFGGTRADDILTISNYVDGSALTYTPTTAATDRIGQAFELT